MLSNINNAGSQPVTCSVGGPAGRPIGAGHHRLGVLDRINGLRDALNVGRNGQTGIVVPIGVEFPEGEVGVGTTETDPVPPGTGGSGSGDRGGVVPIGTYTDEKKDICDDLPLPGHIASPNDGPEPVSDGGIASPNDGPGDLASGKDRPRHGHDPRFIGPPIRHRHDPKPL